eukprot:TRINITY_DN282_c0_g1_i2.p2 TRINITY_DN282_c0_g1~~TRINITY_DN282_c0_g1_i2.p2  ORF type:complete len:150 (+),score=53.32 TRINITY_DN282_c0_g1_i2:78-527(+)
MPRRKVPIVKYTETQRAGQLAESLAKEKAMARMMRDRAAARGLAPAGSDAAVPRTTVRPGAVRDPAAPPAGTTAFDVARHEKPQCIKCKKDNGRCVHGREEATATPRDKYYAPQTSSQVYGWREPYDTIVPKAKLTNIKESFYRKNGVF